MIEQAVSWAHRRGLCALKPDVCGVLWSGPYDEWLGLSHLAAEQETPLRAIRKRELARGCVA